MTTLDEWLAEQKRLCLSNLVIAHGFGDKISKATIALGQAIPIIEKAAEMMNDLQNGYAFKEQAERILNGGRQ